MKFRVEAECTPAEARAFMGLPDVSTLNDHLVAEMKKRMDANVAMLKPDELIRSWMALGGQAQEQFMKLMTTATNAGRGGGKTGG